MSGIECDKFHCIIVRKIKCNILTPRIKMYIEEPVVLRYTNFPLPSQYDFNR